MPGDMDIFVRVVDAGSFSAAARSLAIPKSTVSRRVARLERRLGATLLNRNRRSLGLTAAGHAYYEHAVRIVAYTAEAEDAVRRADSAPRGVLRITAPVTFGHQHLGALVAAYSPRYPDVELNVHLSDDRVCLVEGGFDVAIRAGSPPEGALVARPLGEANQIVCASPSYLAALGTPRTIEELTQHECLVNEAMPAGALWELDDAGTVAVSGRLRSNSWAVLRDAAAAGMGLALLPSVVAAPALRDGRLVRVLPHCAHVLGALYAVHLPSRRLSLVVQSFIDFLEATLSDGPPWATSSRP